MKKTIFERNLEAWEQRFPENSVEINKNGMNIKIRKIRSYKYYHKYQAMKV